jgi:hypothetical protein
LTAHYDDAWFERITTAISSYNLPRLPIEQLVDVSWLGMNELAFGYRLGYVHPQLAVSISLSRLERGGCQSSSQESIALALSDEAESVTSLLRETGVGGVAISVETLWLYVTMRLFAMRWNSVGSADIRYELPDVLASWSDEATADWSDVCTGNRGFRSSNQCLQQVESVLSVLTRRYLSARN